MGASGRLRWRLANTDLPVTAKHEFNQYLFRIAPSDRISKCFLRKSFLVILEGLLYNCSKDIRLAALRLKSFEAKEHALSVGWEEEVGDQARNGG